MFIRILSKKAFFRDKEGNKIRILKKVNQKVLCFQWKNGVVFEERDIEIKMIPKDFRKNEAFNDYERSYISSSDSSLIFQGVGGKEVGFLILDDDDIIRPEPWSNIIDDTTSLIMWDKDDYIISDVDIAENFKEDHKTENDGNLFNHIIYIPDDVGIVINDFLLIKIN